MKRAARILTVMIAPPVLGTVLYVLILSCRQWEGTATILAAPIFAIPVFFYASVITVLPSAVYAVIMEMAFAHGFRPRSLSAVLLSTGLGSLAGLAIAVFFSTGHFNDSFYVLTIIGCVVGVSLGLLWGFLDWLIGYLRASESCSRGGLPSSQGS